MRKKNISPFERRVIFYVPKVTDVQIGPQKQLANYSKKVSVNLSVHTRLIQL